MTECLLRLETAVGVPGQALRDEVDEELVLAAEDLLEGL